MTVKRSPARRTANGHSRVWLRAAAWIVGLAVWFLVSLFAAPSSSWPGMQWMNDHRFALAAVLLVPPIAATTLVLARRRRDAVVLPAALSLLAAVPILRWNWHEWDYTVNCDAYHECYESKWAFDLAWWAWFFALGLVLAAAVFPERRESRDDVPSAEPDNRSERP